jgi:hypothetical protein
LYPLTFLRTESDLQPVAPSVPAKLSAVSDLSQSGPEPAAFGLSLSGSFQAELAQEPARFLALLLPQLWAQLFRSFAETIFCNHRTLFPRCRRVFHIVYMLPFFLFLRFI